VSETSSGPAPARPAKSPSAFRTIGEVADELDLPPHVMRFWESKFPQLKPLKRGGGRRYYRPEDIALLRRIRRCLYHDGYTIRGVQKLLADLSRGGASPAEAGSSMPSLFPLDAALEPQGAAESPGEPPPERPARRTSRRPTTSDVGEPDRRAALEEIRRELSEARALLDALLQRPNER
jgi:DNA-binding transcriptional MerR regulator